MKLSLLTLILIIGTTIPSWACECIFYDIPLSRNLIEFQYNISQYVVIAECLKPSNHGYQFKVLRNFKDAEIGDTLRGYVTTSCSIYPEKKGRWLIYTDRIYSRPDLSLIHI